MKKSWVFFLLFSLLFSESKSQEFVPKDTLYGKVKKIREKVIFLITKENPQFMYDYDEDNVLDDKDYGHYGFLGPEASIAQFRDFWFSRESCYFINYDRTFDENGNIIKDVWFDKKDEIIETYFKIYNENQKLIKEQDSTNFSVNYRLYFYSDYNDVHIISYDSDDEYFWHKYQKFENKQLLFSKIIDENGNVDEKQYVYNPNGKLLYRINLNRKSWKKNGERWTYGIHDSKMYEYKELVNEYDDKNRLIKKEIFDFDSNYNNEPELVTKELFQYNDAGKISSFSRLNNTIKNEFFLNYVYNDKNQLSELYCCDKDILKSKIIKKYEYKDEKISNLECTSQGKTYSIKFLYTLDSQNNWTEIIKLVNGMKLYKWTREIEYF